MEKSQDQRIEELSEMVGGRFKLTTLIVKRLREYYLGGGAFIPRGRNQHELLDMVLDQIANNDIRLRMPEEMPGTGDDEGPGGGAEEDLDITPEELLGEKS